MATNARAVARHLPYNASQHDHYMNFKRLMWEFQSACKQAGIAKEISDRRYFESRSEKSRRKRRESLARLAKQEARNG